MTQHRHPFYDDYDLQLLEDWNNQGNVQPDLADSHRASTSVDAPRVEEVPGRTDANNSYVGI
jgi:hypothetical protein